MKNSFYLQVLYASAFSCLYAQSALAADLSANIGERRLAAVAQARAGNFDQSLPEL